jgi:hypothetical protein
MDPEVQVGCIELILEIDYRGALWILPPKIFFFHLLLVVVFGSRVMQVCLRGCCHGRFHVHLNILVWN